MTARYVTIVRHAWAGTFGDPEWPNDSLRELEPEGIERFTRVVETLADRGFAPDIIATSPYTRCAQTAAIIARHTQHAPEVVELEALEPSSDLRAILEWSRDAQCNHTQCNHICWVGHAPDVSAMAAMLLGDGAANIRFPKGAVASIRLFSEIDYGAGELYWHATAKMLGV